MKKHEIVHMLGTEDGADIVTDEANKMRTRCGRNIDRPVVEGTPSRYVLTAHNGNLFQCTTRERFVSCLKCMNSLTERKPYVRPIRPAVAEKRAVDASAKRARPHA